LEVDAVAGALKGVMDELASHHQLETTGAPLPGREARHDLTEASTKC